jgi:hypothetical protein
MTLSHQDDVIVYPRLAELGAQDAATQVTFAELVINCDRSGELRSDD